MCHPWPAAVFTDPRAEPRVEVLEAKLLRARDDHRQPYANAVLPLIDKRLHEGSFVVTVDHPKPGINFISTVPCATQPIAMGSHRSTAEPTHKRPHVGLVALPQPARHGPFLHIRLPDRHSLRNWAERHAESWVQPRHETAGATIATEDEDEEKEEGTECRMTQPRGCWVCDPPVSGAMMRTYVHTQTHIYTCIFRIHGNGNMRIGGLEAAGRLLLTTTTEGRAAGPLPLPLRPLGLETMQLQRTTANWYTLKTVAIVRVLLSL